MSNILIKKLSFCEHIISKNTEQLLIRPVQLYEVSYPNNSIVPNNFCSNFKLQSAIVYSYKPNQSLKSTRNLNLVNNILTIQNTKFLNPNVNSNIELINNYDMNSLSFQLWGRNILGNMSQISNVGDSQN